MTLRTAVLPSEYAFAADWSSKPVLHAAYTSRGWLVSAAQRGVRSVLSSFDRELAPRCTRVVASDAECTWNSARALALRDGSCLLGVFGFVPESLTIDLDTLATTAAPAWVNSLGEHSVITQLASLDDRYMFVATDHTKTVRLMTMPADASAAPVEFFADFEEQLNAQGNSFVGHRSQFESVIAWGETLLLTHHYAMRMKFKGHALLAVSADGQLLRQRMLTEKADTARFTARDMRWLPDERRGQLLLYGGGVIEALDDQLSSLARVDGHALLKACRPLATDGAGSLLWYDPKARTLIATDAQDLDANELEASLDRLLSAYRSAKPETKAKRSTRAKASPIARPILDLAVLDRKHYRDKRDELLALESTSPETWTPRTLEGIRLFIGEILANASAIPRDQHVLWVGTRLAARSATAQLAAKIHTGGSEHVSVPFGANTLVLPAQPRLLSAYEWEVAWSLSTVVREQACLDLLATVPDSAFDHLGETYRHAWRAAHMAFRTQPAAALPKLQRVYELAQPQHIRYRDDGALRDLIGPLFPMLGALAEHDAAAFQTALIRTLTLHKKTYGTPSKRLNANGMIAWNPLALCCLARDLGLPFDADTEYLPRALIDHSGR